MRIVQLRHLDLRLLFVFFLDISKINVESQECAPNGRIPSSSHKGVPKDAKVRDSLVGWQSAAASVFGSLQVVVHIDTTRTPQKRRILSEWGGGGGAGPGGGR